MSSPWKRLDHRRIAAWLHRKYHWPKNKVILQVHVCLQGSWGCLRHFATQSWTLMVRDLIWSDDLEPRMATGYLVPVSAHSFKCLNHFESIHWCCWQLFVHPIWKLYRMNTSNTICAHFCPYDAARQFWNYSVSPRTATALGVMSTFFEWWFLRHSTFTHVTTWLGDDLKF